MTGSPGKPSNLEKAASCGEPSYVWRTGQQRRLQMILDAAENRDKGAWLENGCGVGTYVQRLEPLVNTITGLEYDFDRCRQAHQENPRILCAAGEDLPFPDGSFDVIISHEVLEHVRDDRQAVQEMARALRPGGRMIIFVPNRGYPFETHGIYWQGNYHFGNIPLVNYLPRSLRDTLAPHVRVYSHRDLDALFKGLNVRVVQQTIIFGAYDNIIQRFPALGRLLRRMLQSLERTPLRRLGLSHLWVVEKQP